MEYLIFTEAEGINKGYPARIKYVEDNKPDTSLIELFNVEKREELFSILERETGNIVKSFATGQVCTFAARETIDAVDVELFIKDKIEDKEIGGFFWLSNKEDDYSVYRMDCTQKDDNGEFIKQLYEPSVAETRMWFKKFFNEKKFPVSIRNINTTTPFVEEIKKQLKEITYGINWWEMVISARKWGKEKNCPMFEKLCVETCGSMSESLSCQTRYDEKELVIGRKVIQKITSQLTVETTDGDDVKRLQEEKWEALLLPEALEEVLKYLKGIKEKLLERLQHLYSYDELGDSIMQNTTIKEGEE
jgi:hypothetical protein